MTVSRSNSNSEDDEEKKESPHIPLENEESTRISLEEINTVSHLLGKKSRQQIAARKYQAIVHWLARYDIARKILLAGSRDSAIRETVTDGIGVYTEKIWPIVVFPLISFHDWVWSGEHNFWKMAGGVSTNQYSWSSGLAGDPLKLDYYWPLYLSASGVFAGLVYKFLQGDNNKNPDLETLQDSVTAVNSNWYEKLCSLQDIARLADSYDPRNKRLGDNQEDAIAALKHLDVSDSSIRSGYQKYLLWSLGKLPASNWLAHAGFMFLSAYLLFAKLRLIELLLMNIILGSMDLQRKQRCEAEQKKFAYMQDYGDEECAVCPDNPYVYYANVFTSQGCLDGLLAEKHTPEEIFTYLEQILKHPDFKELDLSKQDWTNWNVTDWQYFLNKISNVTSHLATLDLSRNVLNPVFPADGHIDALNTFFSKVSIDKLDIRNQGMGDRLLENMLAGLENNINNTLQYLDMSSNQLTDGVAANISQLLLNGRQTLHTLIAEYNRFSDAGIKRIAPLLANSTVTTLNLKGNAFGADGLTALASAIADQNTKLKTVDVSVNDLSLADMGQLGQAVAASNSLIDLNLRKTNINDEMADVFMSAAKNGTRLRLESVDFSSNPLTDQGMFIIISYAANSSITAIYFNENTLTDNGMVSIASVFNQTGLKKFGLARIGNFKAQGLKILLVNAPSTLESLDLQGNNIGDSIVDAFNGTSSTSQLNKINLAANQLTDKSGMSLVRLFANVTDLNLASNFLTDLTMQVLADIFPGKFISLTMDGNNIANDTGVTNLARKLPGSSLQKLSLSNNALGDDSVLAIAEQLVSPAPDKQQLSDAGLSRDEARAFRQTKPATNLTELDLSNNKVNVMGARGVCRVLANTEIKRNNLSFNGNPASDNFHNCQTIFSKKNKSPSSQFFNKRAEHIVAKRHERAERLPNRLPVLQGGKALPDQASTLFSVFVLSDMLLGMVALYLVYCALRPILNSVWEKGSTLFGGDAAMESDKDSVNEHKARASNYGNV